MLARNVSFVKDKISVRAVYLLFTKALALRL